MLKRVSDLTHLTFPETLEMNLVEFLHYLTFSIQFDKEQAKLIEEAYKRNQ